MEPSAGPDTLPTVPTTAIATIARRSSWSTSVPSVSNCCRLFAALLPVPALQPPTPAACKTYARNVLRSGLADCV